MKLYLYVQPEPHFHPQMEDKWELANMKDDWKLFLVAIATQEEARFQHTVKVTE